MQRKEYEEHVAHGDAAFPVGVHREHAAAKGEALFSLHYHPEFEFLLITEGVACVQTEHGMRELAAGEATFINAGELHAARAAKDGCAFLAVVFSPTLIAGGEGERCGTYVRALTSGEWQPPALLPPACADLIREIGERCEEAAPCFELFVKSALLRVFALCAAGATRREEARERAFSDTVKRAIDEIRTHYAEDLTLTVLAARVHVTREHLCRLFRMFSDCPPTVYLNRYRVTQSARLLAATNRTVSEIAFSCGFNNASYYTKQFTRFMHCTPTAYRNERKSGKTLTPMA